MYEPKRVRLDARFDKASDRIMGVGIFIQITHLHRLLCFWAQICVAAIQSKSFQTDVLRLVDIQCYRLRKLWL